MLLALGAPLLVALFACFYTYHYRKARAFFREDRDAVWYEAPHRAIAFEKRPDGTLRMH